MRLFVFGAGLAAIAAVPGNTAAEEEAAADGKAATADAAAEFPLGGWMLGQADSITLTANLPARGPKFTWLIGTSVFVDQQPAQFTIVADGSAIATPVLEGSYAPITAKNVTVRRASGGTQYAGQWRILHSGPNPFSVSRTQWAGAPGKRQLLMALGAPRYMTISFLHGQQCSGGSMKLVIDGKLQVDASGKPLVWTHGNTVFAYGQKVEADVAGTCPADQYMGGEIYYELPVASIK